MNARADHPRILITGGPRTGKTAFGARVANVLGVPCQHSDDLVGVLEWSEASEEVARWMERPGPWVIEGVAVPRALRKWLATNDAGTPADRIYWLTDPFVPQSPGQVAMTKGMFTVWRGIAPAIVARQVEFVVLGTSHSKQEEKRP
jgi:hypothetical protein